MNNFWRGAFLVAAGISLFCIAAFRSAFLTSIERGGSKHHISRLGAVSFGLFLLALGVAGILNGTHRLSSAGVLYIFALATGQLLVTGIYDSYRKARLGSASPFYIKRERRDDDKWSGVVLLILSLAIFIGITCILHFVYPTLQKVSLKLLGALGFVLVILAACLIADLRLNRALKKFDKKKKNRIQKTDGAV